MQSSLIATAVATATITVLASPFAFGAEGANSIRECLQQKVLLTAAAIEPGAYVGHNIVVSVSNGLDWPIAGFRFSYEAYSDGRAIPWIKESIAILVPGGVEPGETREISTSAFVPKDAPDSLVVHGKILDVADQYERQLIRDVRVIGWNSDLSDLQCSSTD